MTTHILFSLFHHEPLYFATKIQFSCSIYLACRSILLGKKNIVNPIFSRIQPISVIIIPQQYSFIKGNRKKIKQIRKKATDSPSKSEGPSLSLYARPIHYKYFSLTDKENLSNPHAFQHIQFPVTQVRHYVYEPTSCVLLAPLYHLLS